MHFMPRLTVNDITHSLTHPVKVIRPAAGVVVQARLLACQISAQRPARHLSLCFYLSEPAAASPLQV